MLAVITKKSIIILNINGENKEVVAKPSDVLLYTLRNELGLTGAKPHSHQAKVGEYLP